MAQGVSHSTSEQFSRGEKEEGDRKTSAVILSKAGRWLTHWNTSVTYGKLSGFAELCQGVPSGLEFQVQGPIQMGVGHMEIRQLVPSVWIVILLF